VTETFQNENEAKKFARRKMADTLNISAGTLNPHLPKRIIPSKQMVQWLRIGLIRTRRRNRPLLWHKEVLMRILALAMLAIGTVSTGPAAGQTYDPAYPVCLHVYGPITYYECRYTSLSQCNVSASGRAAQCVINPYFATAAEVAGYRRHRRVY
jgi:hypothetical protein